MSSAPEGPANYTTFFYRDFKQGQYWSDVTNGSSPRYCVRIPDNKNWEAQCYVPLLPEEFNEENEEHFRGCCPGVFTVEQEPNNCGYVCLTNTSAEEMASRGEKIWTTCVRDSAVNFTDPDKNWTSYSSNAQARCWSKETELLNEQLNDGSSFNGGKGGNLKMIAIGLLLLTGSLLYSGFF